MRFSRIRLSLLIRPHAIENNPFLRIQIKPLSSAKKKLSGISGHRTIRFSLQAASPPSESAYNRQGPFAPQALPRFNTTTNPSDSPQAGNAVHSPAPPFESRPPAGGVSQVPSQTIVACHPLSPRGAEQVHSSISSLPVLASPFLKGWPLLLKFNEAEPGSLSLRLTTLIHRAPTVSLPPPPSASLHVR